MKAYNKKKKKKWSCSGSSGMGRAVRGSGSNTNYTSFPLCPSYRKPLLLRHRWGTLWLQEHRLKPTPSLETPQKTIPFIINLWNLKSIIKICYCFTWIFLKWIVHSFLMDELKNPLWFLLVSHSFGCLVGCATRLSPWKLNLDIWKSGTDL